MAVDNLNSPDLFVFKCVWLSPSFFVYLCGACINILHRFLIDGRLDRNFITMHRSFRELKISAHTLYELKQMLSNLMSHLAISNVLNS